MCLAAIPLIASAVGTAVSFKAGMQESKTADAIAERNAKMQEAAGRYEAKQISRKLTYTQSQANVNAAANGIGATGTFLDIINDNEIQGEIDMENSRRQTFNKAASTRFEGKAASNRLKNNAVGNLISGIGQTADAATKYLKVS